VDVTVTLEEVTNVGFNSSYDPASPLPMNFVGYAVLTSTQPVAGLLVRAKWVWSDNSTNEPTYTAVNGRPRANAANEWALPLIYRRYEKQTPSSIGRNSWFQVQVADGSDAETTVRFVGIPGSGCPEGPFETTSMVSGSKVFYMNLDADNGFPNDNQPNCFVGSAAVSSDKEIIVIGQVSDDGFPGGDNEGLYSAVPQDAEVGPFVQIVAADEFACGLLKDQTVTCWGDEYRGQTAPRGGTFTQLSSGYEHVCGLTTAGDVSCWGQIPPENEFRGGPFTAVSAGLRFTCALAASGQITCWGDNQEGQSTPPNGAFSSVSAGGFHGCGVLLSGLVDCWGADPDGQASPPDGVFDDVSAGHDHTCGVRPDGRIVCWGRNNVGQSDPPDGLYSTVSAGTAHTCAVDLDGYASCWGGEEPPPAFGLWGPYSTQITGMVGAVSGPVAQLDAGPLAWTCGVLPGGLGRCWSGPDLGGLPPPGSFVKVSTGDTHSCAIRFDGSLACWGVNYQGQLDSPGGRFIDIAAGGFHTCAVDSAGSLACWGSNAYGQSTAPTGSFTRVEAGRYFTCGLRTSGAVDCWGAAFVAGKQPAGTFTEIGAGDDYACAVTVAAGVECWGIVPHNTFPPSPDFFPPAELFRTVSPGVDHTCGDVVGGEVRCWGINTLGQLDPPDGLQAVASGNSYSCGLRPDGTVRCWGTDGYGNASPPAGTFSQLSASWYRTCGVREDGRVACWGSGQPPGYR